MSLRQLHGRAWNRTAEIELLEAGTLSYVQTGAEDDVG
jgi:hypothetical protein